MSFSKNIRIIMKIIVSVILLSFPFLAKVYYQKFYYALVLIFILLLALMEIFSWEKNRDKRFLAKWPKVRDRGIWINVILVALGSFFFMSIMVALGQLFGNGLTPLDIFNTLPGESMIKILLLLVFFSLSIGILSWYENQRKYEKLYRKRKV